MMVYNVFILHMRNLPPRLSLRRLDPCPQPNYQYKVVKLFDSYKYITMKIFRPDQHRGAGRHLQDTPLRANIGPSQVELR